MEKENQIYYNGETIPYKIRKSKIKNMYICIKDGNVLVKAPNSIKNETIFEFVEKKSKWIYEKVKQDKLKPRIYEQITQEDIIKLEQVVKKYIYKYMELLNEMPNKVRIRDIKYAWGTCSSNKNITINQKLANKQEHLIEYVVLHEMCHLKYMNHSEKFWSLVGKYMPEYKEYRKALKE